MTKHTFPATTLSGHPTAYMTKRLNHILKNHEGMSVSVIVKDMIEVSIDANLVHESEADISCTDVHRVEMNNVCVSGGPIDRAVMHKVHGIDPVTAQASLPAIWRELPDPFPAWGAGQS